ncbi:hypothetical protein M514_08565 [Trichuris suis]|uniref:Uncharacterized protein n=1 Tax=Trichuris suis TaxID=68888 RepID=A0A085NE13_9BILA|nr:hypothetical protein M513_08565 [Trichuris suis]KFD67709.1 hypothetical protein M514_08565 [Trichuris suis]
MLFFHASTSGDPEGLLRNGVELRPFESLLTKILTVAPAGRQRPSKRALVKGTSKKDILSTLSNSLLIDSQPMTEQFHSNGCRSNFHEQTDEQSSVTTTNGIQLRLIGLLVKTAMNWRQIPCALPSLPALAIIRINEMEMLRKVQLQLDRQEDRNRTKYYC